MDAQNYLKLLRVYKHDFLNHLQVLLGYLQLNKDDKALDYVKKAIAELEKGGSLMRLELPELVLWLLIQRLELKEKGIELTLENHSQSCPLKDREGELLHWFQSLVEIITDKLETLAIEKRQLSICFGNMEFNGSFVITVTLPPLEEDLWPGQLKPCLETLPQWEADHSFKQYEEKLVFTVLWPTKE